MDGWILIEDLIPKENEKVLVATDTNDIYIGRYCTFFNGFITAESKGHEIEQIPNVVAWRSLPEFKYSKEKVKCKVCIFYDIFKNYERVGRCKINGQLMADVQTCKRGRIE